MAKIFSNSLIHYWLLDIRYLPPPAPSLGSVLVSIPDCILDSAPDIIPEMNPGMH